MPISDRSLIYLLRPYRFESAEKLIADFFNEIEPILREKDNG